MDENDGKMMGTNGKTMIIPLISPLFPLFLP